MSRALACFGKVHAWVWSRPPQFPEIHGSQVVGGMQHNSHCGRLTAVCMRISGDESYKFAQVVPFVTKSIGLHEVWPRPDRHPSAERHARNHAAPPLRSATGRVRTLRSAWPGRAAPRWLRPYAYPLAKLGVRSNHKCLCRCAKMCPRCGYGGDLRRKLRRRHRV